MREISISAVNRNKQLFHYEPLVFPVISRLWLFPDGATVTAAGFLYELLGFAPGVFIAVKSDSDPACLLA